MTYNPPPTDYDINLEDPLYKNENWYLIDKERIHRHREHPGKSMIVHKCPDKHVGYDKRSTIAYTNKGYSRFSTENWCPYCNTSPKDDLKTLWVLHNADIISMFTE